MVFWLIWFLSIFHESLSFRPLSFSTLNGAKFHQQRNQPASRHFSTLLLFLKHTAVPVATADLVFVGGKGGVGKTSTAAAIATKLSERYRTLVVSTDPAHSLGDAFSVDLSCGKVMKLEDSPNLWCYEINVKKLLGDFNTARVSLDAPALVKNTDIPRDLLSSFCGQNAFAMLEKLPPGIDEVLALTQIHLLSQRQMETEQGLQRAYEKIVVDTAPTGHTLRLLQLPSVADSMLGRLIRFRNNVVNGMKAIRDLFRGKDTGRPQQETAIDQLETTRQRLLELKQILMDPEKSQFVVVCNPTSLAFMETEKLIQSLHSDRLPISSIVCNKIIPDIENVTTYIDDLRQRQELCIDKLKFDALAQTLPFPWDVATVVIPESADDFVGVQRLKHFASFLRNSTNYPSRLLSVFTGKGGVGKTSSSASWATILADEGHRTLIVSTDPAHSLGDALNVSLAGGRPVLVSRNKSTNGELWAMEISPTETMKELAAALKSDAVPKDDPALHPASPTSAAPATGSFQSMLSGIKSLQDATPTSAAPATGSFQSMLSGIKSLFKKSDKANTLATSSSPEIAQDDQGQVDPFRDIFGSGLSGVKSEIGDFLQEATAPPPGSDEVFALMKVTEYLQEGYAPSGNNTILFDRIVIDTAPTGHTLRMLELPKFLLEVLRQFRTMKEALQLPALADTNREEEPDKLTRFEGGLESLQDLLLDQDKCEFNVVTIPTELAVAESKRLMIALHAKGMILNRLIINHVTPPIEQMRGWNESAKTEESKEAVARQFFKSLQATQKPWLERIRSLSTRYNISLLEIPELTEESRGLGGLRRFGFHLFPTEGIQ